MDELDLTRTRHYTKSAPQVLKRQVGRILTDDDSDVTYTGPVRIETALGQLLAVYLPGVLADMVDQYRPIISKIRIPNRNRVLASGSRMRVKGNVNFANEVLSGTIGYMEKKPTGFAGTAMCRTTAWTGSHTQEFAALYPYFQRIGELMAKYAPDRWEAQMEEVRSTPPEYVISGTPYSTVTVNINYPTGVHKDAGDLDKGMSCLAMLRKGDYQGGCLTFPEWRFRFDMQDGDLLLMDAHQWHGNTMLSGMADDCERISLVLYYRTDMVSCDTPLVGSGA